MIGSATVARCAARGWGLYAVGIALTAACGVLYLASALPPIAHVRRIRAGAVYAVLAMR